MLTEEKLKQEIQNLINDFKANYQKYKRELEPNTETKLVEPLFELLGWTKKDFVKQERARRGRKRGYADYGFYIDERMVFFMEVKRVGIPLDKEADKQVISYALSKRIPFAVSTNFEELKIFCVEQENAIKNVFRTFKKPEDYINNLHDLLFLSKESFEKKLILKKAEEEERLKKRISIDKTLLKDLMHIRELIANDIEKNCPKKYEINEKDDIVQRIIDRLIFIRKCEDISINPDNLYLEEIKHLPDNKALPKLKEIFKKYNKIYNAGLFAVGIDNDCDKITINGAIIKNLIYYLYESKDKQFIYNFDWIDADVLGQVYEQYLGKILAQTGSGKAKLRNGQVQRRGHGIYYTPIYIVDYIVKNTVEKLLENKKIKIQNIKILDPACGSGSFLIKAFDYLYNDLISKKEIKQQKIDSQGTYSVKTEILKNNLYGVDLDNKAVEITKLNLLLKAAEKNRRLPEELDLHIKQGNSLIDDEEIGGLDYFKWIGDFQEGSFDVVIGNPPWGADISADETNYFVSRYGVSKKNLNSFDLFVRKAITLLREGGFFGFVIPKNSIKSNDYLALRKNILENTLVKKLTLFGMFEGVTQEFVVLIFTKNKESLDIKNKNKIIINDKDVILQKRFYENTDYIFNPELKQAGSIIKKVEVGKPLDKFIFIKRGEEISKKGKIFLCYLCNNWFPASKQETKNCLHCNKKLILSKCKKYEMVSNYQDSNHSVPIITGEDISAYGITIKHYFDSNKKGISYKNKDMYSGERLLMNKIASTFKVGFVDKDSYCTQNVYVIKIVDKDKNKLKVLLALFNSKLWRYYYEKKFNLGAKITTAISLNNVRNLKFPDTNKTISEKIIKLVDKMISLNKSLNKIGDKKTHKKKKLEENVKDIYKEINKIVYNLYNIKDKEKDIINKSIT